MNNTHFVQPLMTKEQRAKTKNSGMNRADARAFHKDLARTLRGLRDTDEQVVAYRAKRRAKRLQANKTRSKNRRLAK